VQALHTEQALHMEDSQAKLGLHARLLQPMQLGRPHIPWQRPSLQ